MTNYIYKIFGILTVAFALPSCSDEVEVPRVVDIDEGAWEYIELPLSVAPADEVLIGDIQSRAIIDNDDASCEIHDLWVLQYNGTTDDAILIGKQQYFGINDLTDGTDSHPLEKLVSAKFVKSDTQCRIVVLANTFDPGLTFTKYSTLGDLKDRYRDSRERLSGIFSFDSADEDPSATFPGDFDYYIEMNGYVDLKTSADDLPDCIKLERNLTRIDFTLKVKNENGSPIVTFLSDPILCDTQRYIYYFTNYTHADNYQSSVTNLFDMEYCKKVEPTTETVTEDDGTEISYTVYKYRYYCAPNYRGTVESVTTPKNKNTYAPKGATYLRIPGTCSEDGIPVCYTVYLGANHTNDYNLKANHCYSFTLKLDTTGDADTDSRVEKWPDVDFRDYTERSNCYILNPPVGDGQTRSFKVPIDRIHDYWGSTDYGNTANNDLGTLTYWDAFVVWADFDYNSLADDGLTPKFQLVKDNGQGCFQSDNTSEYFEVEVASNVCGNVVVAVKANAGTNILWSWHLWITDYDPDRAFRTGISPTTGKYVYSVPGGQIHRYGGPDWENGGELENSFIMDRYLGAFSSERVDQGGTWASPDYTFPIGGGLLYQYGRKDPTYYPACDGTLCPPTSQLYFASGYKMDVQSSLTTAESWINTGVYSPTMVLKNDNNFGKNWFDETGKDLERKNWLDPINVNADNIYGKSIFDPSPLGWRVPYAEYKNLDGYRTLYPWADFDETTTYTFKDPDTGSDILYENFYYKTNQGYYVDISYLKPSTLGQNYMATVYSPYMINPETETFSYLIYGSMLYWPNADTENINTDIIYPVYRYSANSDIGWVWTSGPYGGYYNVENHGMSTNNAGGYNAFVRCVRDWSAN